MGSTRLPIPCWLPLFLAGTGLSLGVSGRPEAARSPGARAARLQLCVLHGRWGGLGLRYDWATAWPILQRQDRTRCAASLTERDVSTYRCGKHELVLTPAASAALRAALSSRNRGESPDLDLRGFVVAFDGRPLYGGIFLFPMSAMGISFPVIYPRREGARLVLAIRPTHVPFGKVTSTTRIEDTALFRHLAAEQLLSR